MSTWVYKLAVGNVVCVFTLVLYYFSSIHEHEIARYFDYRQVSYVSIEKISFFRNGERSITSIDNMTSLIFYHDPASEYYCGVTFKVNFRDEVYLKANSSYMNVGKCSLVHADIRTVKSSWKTPFGVSESHANEYIEVTIHHNVYLKGIIKTIFRIYNRIVAVKSEFSHFSVSSTQVQDFSHNIFASFEDWSNDTLGYFDLGNEKGYKIVEFGNDLPYNSWKQTFQKTPFTLASSKLSKFMTISEACNYGWKNMELVPNMHKIPTGGLNMNFLLHVGRNLFQSPYFVFMLSSSETGVAELSTSSKWSIRNLCESPSQNINWSFVSSGKVYRDMSLSLNGTESALASIIPDSKIDFLLLDAGWYGNEYNSSSNPLLPVKKGHNEMFDLKRIVQRASLDKIGVFVYVNDIALQNNAFEIFQMLRRTGVVGVKFGFVDVSTAEHMTRILSYVHKCAQLGLMVNIHDNFREFGISRTFPNLVSTEGVKGDEHDDITMEHILTLPFVRASGGLMDFTFTLDWKRLAAKNVSLSWQYTAPFILCNGLQHLYWYLHPTTYIFRQKGSNNEHPWLYLRTNWKRSVVLEGSIGKFLVVSRESHDGFWIIAAMSTVSKNISFSLTRFMSKGTYSCVMYIDDERTVFSLLQAKNNQKVDVETRSLVLKWNDNFTMSLKRGIGILAVLTKSSSIHQKISH